MHQLVEYCLSCSTPPLLCRAASCDRVQLSGVYRYPGHILRTSCSACLTLLFQELASPRNHPGMRNLPQRTLSAQSECWVNRHPLPGCGEICDTSCMAVFIRYACYSRRRVINAQVATTRSGFTACFWTQQKPYHHVDHPLHSNPAKTNCRLPA